MSGSSSSSQSLSATASFLRWQSGQQTLQDSVDASSLPDVNSLSLHRGRSEPIMGCDNRQQLRRFSHLQPSSLTLTIKPRSPYDAHTSTMAIEHDELPTLSEKERRHRDVIRRDTRVALLADAESDLALGSKEGTGVTYNGESSAAEEPSALYRPSSQPLQVIESCDPPMPCALLWRGNGPKWVS